MLAASEDPSVDDMDAIIEVTGLRERFGAILAPDGMPFLDVARMTR
jgi:hypothetical protein